MAIEDWKLQVSYKSPTGDLINVRANTSDELSVLLEGVSDYATQIAATGKLLAGAYTAAPLGTTGLTAGTTPAVTSSIAPTSEASPTCVHGSRKFLLIPLKNFRLPCTQVGDASDVGAIDEVTAGIVPAVEPVVPKGAAV